MDANLVFLFMVVISAVVTLWRCLFVFPLKYNRGWVVEIGLILAIGAVGWFVIPTQIGYVVGGVWLIFVIVPSLLQRLAISKDNQGQYKSALRFATPARLLHPADQLFYFPDMIRSRQYTAEGKYEEAKSILQRLSLHHSTDFYAISNTYWLTGDYEGLLQWMDSHFTEEDYKRDPNMVTRYLSTLGTLGDLNGMLNFFNMYRATLEKSTAHLNYGLLYVFTACGSMSQVEQLLNSAFADFNPVLRQQWIAIAQIAAGQVEQGKATLTHLLNSGDGQIRRSIQNYLARPPIDVQTVLSDESKILLAKITQQYQNYQRYDRSQASSRLRRQYVTVGLIIIILAIYVLEIQQGGDSDIDTLYRLGALWPPAVIQGGEWWRLISVMFLHYGFLHVALNLLALAIIGPSIESMLGRIRYTVVYLVAGIGSAYMAVLFTQLKWVPPEVYVGASGAIMGLFGASAAIYLQDWRTHRSGIALNFLRRAAFIIVLQVVADLTIPGTSLAIHLLGAIIGFVVALPLNASKLRKPLAAST